MTDFKKRVYGAVVVRAINANYNADFSGQPRTLPSGTVYATDKTFKHAVRYFLNETHADKKVFYIKTLNDNLNPRTLDERYKVFLKGKDSDSKVEVAKKLLSCLDIRLFGATFTGNKVENISFHGPVQVGHAINLWHQLNPLTYREQITSPFRNSESKKAKGSNDVNEQEMTTIGSQSRIEEGHYIHHFSIYPNSLNDICSALGKGAKHLSIEDVALLKEAMRKCVTWYDSSSKIGCDNEMLVWVTLREKSRLALPSFVSLISLEAEKADGKCVYNLSMLKDVIDKHSDDIESIEIYYDNMRCSIKNEPENVEKYDIIWGKAIQ